MQEVLLVYTKSEAETQKFAKLLGEALLKLKLKHALVVGLEGELGSGKTVFVKGFAKGLGINEEMKSPSFILMRAFRIPRTSRHFFHFDAYRIENSKEFCDIGFTELLKNPSHILLVEWADKVSSLLPRRYFRIVFKNVSRRERGLTLFV